VSGPRLTIVAALDEDDLIGAGGRLPWHLPADLARFRRLTLGRPVLMGRRTYESIGRALPGRDNLVITSRRGYRAPGCRVVADLEAALAACRERPEAMIIGGARLYAAALGRCTRMHLTRVHHRFRGDTRFPPYDPREWLVRARETREPDAANPYRLTFLTLERVAPGPGSGAGPRGAAR